MLNVQCWMLDVQPPGTLPRSRHCQTADIPKNAAFRLPLRQEVEERVAVRWHVQTHHQFWLLPNSTVAGSLRAFTVRNPMKKLFLSTLAALFTVTLLTGCQTHLGGGSTTRIEQPTLGQQLIDLQRARTELLRTPSTKLRKPSCSKASKASGLSWGRRILPANRGFFIPAALLRFRRSTVADAHPDWRERL